MPTKIIIIGAVILVIAVYIYFSYRRMKNIENIPDSSMIKVLTNKNFKLQVKSGIVLVDFWASWCMPCKLMTPVLNDIAESESDTVKVAKVNIEKEQQLANKFKVRNIPTLLVFQNGKLVDKIVGVKTKKQIMGVVNKL